MKRVVAIVVAVLAIVSACGGDEREVASPTFDQYFSSFTLDYEPAKDRTELAARSTLVVEATLVDVVDGPIFGDSADDPFASRFALFVFQSDLVSVPIGVMLPRPTIVDGNKLEIASIRDAVPLGARAVLYLAPWPYGPISAEEQKLWFGLDGGLQVLSFVEGVQVWQFTTPQGFILENTPDTGVATILPIGADGGLADAPPKDADVGSWLPPGGPVIPPELRA